MAIAEHASLCMHCSLQMLRPDLLRLLAADNTGVYGGAIRVEGGATLNITDSVLLWNNAQWGAGVAAITGSTLLLLDSVTFHGNAQGASTNTTASGGGAVYVGQACVGVMQSVTFASNGVTGANGASNLVNVSLPYACD